MTICVRDARNSGGAQLFIRSVYRDYVDDLSLWRSSGLSEISHAQPDPCAHWICDPSAHPLIILKDNAAVGFAMVAGPSRWPRIPPVDYRMEDFFVLRAFRRLGVGQCAVDLILSRFAGWWEISQHLRNVGAVRFWRRVVARYTGGNYQERIFNDEVRQVFDSARRV